MYFGLVFASMYIAKKPQPHILHKKTQELEQDMMLCFSFHLFLRWKGLFLIPVTLYLWNHGLIPQFLHLNYTEYVWGLWLLWEGRGTVSLFQWISSKFFHNFPGDGAGVDQMLQPLTWGCWWCPHVCDPLASCFNVCIFIWSDPAFPSTQQLPDPSPELCHNFSFFSDSLLVIQSCLVSPVLKVCTVFGFSFFFHSFQLPPHLPFISVLKAFLLSHYKVPLLPVCPNTFSVPSTELKLLQSIIFISFTKSTSKLSSSCLCNVFLTEFFPPSTKSYVLSWLSASQICISVMLFSQAQMSTALTLLRMQWLRLFS